jgi:hypothetical protein
VTHSVRRRGSIFPPVAARVGVPGGASPRTYVGAGGA